jgi:hypothetical protein
MISPLIDAYADLFSPYPWEWFVTLTFVTSPHPESAWKKWRLFTSKMNRELYGPRWSKKAHGGVVWVACAEYQKRGSIHIHALMIHTRSLRRLSYMDLWNDLDYSTGFARIEEVKDAQKSCRYLCKYVAKHGDLYFSDNLKDISSDLLSELGPAE